MIYDDSDTSEHPYVLAFFAGDDTGFVRIHLGGEIDMLHHSIDDLRELRSLLDIVIDSRLEIID